MPYKDAEKRRDAVRRFRARQKATNSTVVMRPFAVPDAIPTTDQSSKSAGKWWFVGLGITLLVFFVTGHVRQR